MARAFKSEVAIPEKVGGSRTFGARVRNLARDPPAQGLVNRLSKLESVRGLCFGLLPCKFVSPTFFGFDRATSDFEQVHFTPATSSFLSPACLCNLVRKTVPNPETKRQTLIFPSMLHQDFHNGKTTKRARMFLWA